jgi:heme exporter protein B
MLVPVVVASVEATSAILAGDPMGDASAWLRLLVVFDAVFFTASVLAFEHVIDE